MPRANVPSDAERCHDACLGPSAICTATDMQDHAERSRADQSFDVMPLPGSFSCSCQPHISPKDKKRRCKQAQSFFMRSCASLIASFVGGRVHRIQPIGPPGLGNETMAQKEPKIGCCPRLLRPIVVTLATAIAEESIAPPSETKS